MRWLSFISNIMFGLYNFIPLLLASNAACWRIPPDEKSQISHVPNKGPFDAGLGYLMYQNMTWLRKGIPDSEMQKNFQGFTSYGLPGNATKDELHLFEAYLPSQVLPKDWQIAGNMTPAHHLPASAYQNAGPDICLSHLCAMVAGHVTGSRMFDADFFYFNPNSGDESPNPHSAVARGVFQWSWYEKHGGHLVYKGQAPGPWKFLDFTDMTPAQWAYTVAGSFQINSTNLIRNLGTFESIQTACELRHPLPTMVVD